MEGYNQLKKKEEKGIIQKFFNSFFDIMLQLLKNKTTDRLWACVLIFIMFSQVIAGLFERNIFGWKDEYLLETFIQFCEYVRILDAINHSNSETYYWILFYFGLSYILLIIILLVYLYQALKHPQIYFESIIQLLRVLLLLSYWVLFLPFYESFISIFKCNDKGTHYIAHEIGCYSTTHIILILVSIACLAAFIAVNVIVALLFNETQPVKEDALSRLDSNFEIIMLVYRILVGTLSQFCMENYCSYIIICVSILSSVYFQFQYFKYLPYYNSFVSIFFGAMLGIYTWISMNALLMELYQIEGHIIVILIGIIPTGLCVKFLREKRMEWLINMTTEKMHNDIDSLNQIITIQKWLNETGNVRDLDEQMRVKGLINLHLFECVNEECVCSNIEDCYDFQNDRYLSKDIQDLHKNQIFVNHFNKQLYSEALNKFINSPSIHISFAFYQFSVMRNIHAAIHELKIASKKRPTIQQQFTIFRYQNIIEIFIKKESEKMKHIYEQLTNVKEFERLFYEMQKQIEKVCNHQVEFWTHLTTVIPDLNYLSDLNMKIYHSSQEADKYWYLLCQINPHYPQALNMYGEYLTYIRNNSQAGKEYFDKAHNVNFAQKSVQEHIKKSDILFTEDACVVHISGNKESSGRILKTSQGLKKCFGWDKQEVIGHNVNFLMPSLFAERHNEFVDQYYKTGRQHIFNKERQYFALNKTGYCFTMKILIKQMPSLSEGVQYCGVVRPIMTDYEYIITDTFGHIDSYTSGVGTLLNLNPQIFKDNSLINIQIIAPELIPVFEFKRTEQKNNEQQAQDRLSSSEIYQRYGRRSSYNNFSYGNSKSLQNSKFAVPGGDALNFIIPQNFVSIIKTDKSAKSNRTKQKGKKGEETGPPGAIQSQTVNKQSIAFKDFLKYLSKGGGKNYGKKPPEVKKILQCKEYKEFDIKKTVTAEIREWTIPLGNSEEKGLKLLLFIISKTQSEKKPQDLQSFDQPLQHPNQYQQNIDNQFINDTDHQNQQRQYNQMQQQRQGRGGQQQERNDQHQMQQRENNSSFQKVLHQNQQMINDLPQLQGAVSFLEIDPNAQKNQEPLTPIREVDSAMPDSGDKKLKNKLGKKVDQAPPGKNEIQMFKKTNKEALELDLNFERQETDEQEEDNEDKLSTERIDVKKDIALNDDIKQNTKSIEENYSAVKSSSKMSLKLQNNQTGSKDFDNPASLKKEESKSQLKNKPLMEYISQSKDNPDSEEPEEDGEDGDDEEDGEEYDDDEFDDEDGDDDDGHFISDGSEQNKSQGSREDLVNGQNDQRQKRSRRNQRQNQNQNNQQNWNQQNNIERQQTNQDQRMQQQNQDQKKSKIHDYSRIVTHPRYKYFDEETCGSAYFNECNASERELDIREMIKKHETTKKRRERRKKKRKEDEVKKLLSNNNTSDEEEEKKVTEKPEKEDKADQEGENGRSRGKKIKKEEESKSDSKSKSRSRSRSRKSESSGDQENNQDQEGESQDQMQREHEQEMQNDEGEVSSIASSLQSQTRTYFSLRTAIDEKFVPRSILNLRFVANFVFFIILLLGIVNYATQTTLFNDIKNYIEIIINSEKRINDITKINLSIDDMTLINEGILDQSNYAKPKDDLLSHYTSVFLNSSTGLQSSQTLLSLQTSGLKHDSRVRINPENVALQYEKVNNMPETYLFNIWEAIVQIVVIAYKVAETPFQVSHNNTQVTFITYNCMNPVMSALKESTNAIIDESNQASNSNNQTFLFLLVAVSCAQVIGMGFLMPVIKRAKNNKQEVFELFTHRKVEKCIDEQLKKCRWFITKYQAQAENQNYDAAIEDKEIEENTHIPEKEMTRDDEKKDEYMKNYKKQKKKWKKLNINFGMLMLRFVTIQLLIEAFFLYAYFTSRTFLEQVSQLSSELRLLISRQPQLYNLILMEKELFVTNNTATFLFNPVKTVVEQAYKTQYQDYESLLNTFSNNYNYHTDKYNTEFNKIVYSDVCQYLEFGNYTLQECQSFNGGILQKGIYNSVVKYWSSLNQLHNDFFGSSRSAKDIRTFINHPKLIVSETMCVDFFEKSHWHLVYILKEDIDSFFETQYSQSQTVFIIFLLYLLLIYFFLWKIFMRNLIEELWKAKSVLRQDPQSFNVYSVLPVEVCFRIEEIRNFIYRNSSNIGARGMN